MSVEPPPLADNEDQAVIRFDLRRVDPTGGEDSDILEKVKVTNQDLVLRFLQVCRLLGFDPDISYVTIESVRDVQDPTGFQTISELVYAVAENPSPSQVSAPSEESDISEEAPEEETYEVSQPPAAPVTETGEPEA